MKAGSSPFFRWKNLTAALVMITGWLFAPALCQTSDVALLLRQTPDKGGAITPDAGVYHFKINSEVIITAAPKPGYQFAYWLGDVSDPSAISTVVYLDKPKVIIAVFEQSGYGVPSVEKGISGGGGGGGGGNGFVQTVMTFGQAGNISSVSGGIKTKMQNSTYPKTNQVVPEPATCILLVIGSVFALSGRRNKRKF